MNLFSWLRKRINAGHSDRRGQGGRRAAKSRPAARSRPRLEVLEDRCLLSASPLDPTFGSGGVATSSVTANLFLTARPFRPTARSGGSRAGV